MALRFAYFPAVQELARIFPARRMTVLLIVAAAVVPVLIGFFLATDTMRTAGILISVAMWGAIEFAKRGDTLQWRWLVVAALLVPAAQVSYTKVAPINCLPYELWRILR